MDVEFKASNCETPVSSIILAASEMLFRMLLRLLRFYLKPTYFLQLHHSVFRRDREWSHNSLRGPFLKSVIKGRFNPRMNVPIEKLQDARVDQFSWFYEDEELEFLRSHKGTFFEKKEVETFSKVTKMCLLN